MQAPEGYSIRKVIADLPRKFVALAVRERDQAEVVLKAYPEDSNESDADNRARREFEALRSLAPGVGPLALSLEEDAGSTFLVLEPFAGQIPRGPLDAQAFLQVAIGAASAVAAIHRARIVHRSLAPTKLLLGMAPGKVCIAGFGRSAPLGAPADLEDILGRASANALFYLSPEQTGRLDRGIDFRSDLYSLGASFYELLSGRPPFDARDPLDLIHAHIAKRPRSPAELQEGVSGTLARITMKLLEKEPEDRYQTAEALGVDLETCLEQLQRTGSIDDELPLGAADAPYRPLFRRRIYGREDECDSLRRAYREASAGRPSLVLVRGAPGIGKSSLVPELYQPLALDGGYLARGKFDLYRRHLPYAGFASALRSLIRQIASESLERREVWKRALDTALGPLGGALAEFLPELAMLLGTLPEVPPLEPGAAKERLALVVRRLICGAADLARPLVLFLDDLQWADAGSRFLMEELLLTGGTSPLLVIGAYRDDEVDAVRRVDQLRESLGAGGVQVNELALTPLTSSAVCEMLGDALGRDREQVAPLASRIEAQSGRNPLLVQQCVYHLHHMEYICYRRGEGWGWDEQAISKAVIPDDPVGMMLVRLQRLSGEARTTLQLASCIGDEFDVALLMQLSQRDRSSLEVPLYELSDEGLIAPSRGGFRFVHDRIREAAQSQLAEQERELLHYRTANLLVETLSDAERPGRIFEIADHLSRCQAQIPVEATQQAVDAHREAGLTALRSGAFATAGHYFNAGLDLLEARSDGNQSPLWFELRFRAATCSFQSQRFQEALERLAPLRSARLSRLQGALVAALRIRISSASRHSDATLELLFESLEAFGCRLPRHPSWLRVRLEILRIDWRLRGEPEHWPFFPLRPGTDPGAHAQMLLAVAGAQIVGKTSSRLVCLSAAADLRSMLDLGYSFPPVLALAGFAAARRAVLWNSNGLRRYIEAVEDGLRKAPNPVLGPAMRYILQFSMLPWIGPRKDTLAPLQQIAEQLGETGQAQLQTSALSTRACHAFLCGMPLRATLGLFEDIRQRAHLSPVETPKALAAPVRWLVECGEPGPELSKAQQSLEKHRDSIYQLAPNWMLALTVAGDFEAVWRISELMRDTIFDQNAGGAHVADFLMCRGLAAAAISRTLSLTTAFRYRICTFRCERRLSVVAKRGPDFVHMAAMLRCERLRTSGNRTKALAGYAAAAERAELLGYLHHAGIAHERRASILAELSHPDQQQSALERALGLYRTWGADAKVQQLQAQLSDASSSGGIHADPKRSEP